MSLHGITVKRCSSATSTKVPTAIATTVVSVSATEWSLLKRWGLYHNWTYIDGIELYAFNGKRVELIQKRDYDKVHRNEAFVRMESEAMVKDFLAGILKAQRTSVPADQLESQAKELIDGCYKSFLDSDFNTRLTQILPAIEQR